MLDIKIGKGTKIKNIDEFGYTTTFRLKKHHLNMRLKNIAKEIAKENKCKDCIVKIDGLAYVIVPFTWGKI